MRQPKSDDYTYLSKASYNDFYRIALQEVMQAFPHVSPGRQRYAACYHADDIIEELEKEISARMADSGNLEFMDPMAEIVRLREVSEEYLNDPSIFMRLLISEVTTPE